MGKPDANGDVWPDPDDESAGVTTAHDELRRIAETNDGDVGTLARILLAGVEGDNVTADEPVPDVQYDVGERRVNPDDDLLYEYTDQGWVRVDQLAHAEVAEPAPADKTDGDNDELASERTKVGRVPTDVPVVDSPTGPTPPFGGAPDAPNTTVDDTSADSTDTGGA